LLRLVGQRGGALVAHLGQLLDGTLLDFGVLVVEQSLPHLEQIGATMNFFDKFDGIIGQTKFSTGNLFLAGRGIGFFRRRFV